MTVNPDVLIVGAGLAGLCCGRRLAQCGVPFRIHEAADGVGGRVRTDVVDGFRLDRGLQLYFTAYPEGKRVLDFDSLDLKPFARHVLVHVGGRFRRVEEPEGGWLGEARAVLRSAGSIEDKFRLVKFRWGMEAAAAADPGNWDEQLTLDLLRWSGGFSPAIIDQYFRPFFGGIFREPDLATSSRAFRFLYRALSEGPIALPANGMQVIPEQVAAGLPPGSVRLNSRVERLGEREVVLRGNSVLRGRAVVVATDGPTAARLLGDKSADPGLRGDTTLYYAATAPPHAEPVLMLNGDTAGPVNRVAVVSNVAPTYAPSGQSLIAASVIGIPASGDSELDAAVRTQLSGWFDGVSNWRLLRIYRIPDAVPDQTAGKLDPWQRPVRVRPGLYVCGDHRDNGTLDGAMASGFRTAQAVMEDLHAHRT